MPVEGEGESEGMRDGGTEGLRDEEMEGRRDGGTERLRDLRTHGLRAWLC
jgi:hypothetical protein